MVHAFAKLGPKGQIVLPKEFRDENHLIAGEKVLIEGNAIQLTVRPITGDFLELIRTFPKVKDAHISPHEAYDDQMEHRDRKRDRKTQG